MNKKYTIEELRPSMVHYNVHTIHYDKGPFSNWAKIQTMLFKGNLIIAKGLRCLHRSTKINRNQLNEGELTENGN